MRAIPPLPVVAIDGNQSIFGIIGETLKAGIAGLVIQAVWTIFHLMLQAVGFVVGCILFLAFAWWLYDGGGFAWFVRL